MIRRRIAAFTARSLPLRELDSKGAQAAPDAHQCFSSTSRHAPAHAEERAPDAAQPLPSATSPGPSASFESNGSAAPTG